QSRRLERASQRTSWASAYRRPAPALISGQATVERAPSGLYAHRLRFRSLWPAAEVSPFGCGLAVLELPAEPESLEQVRLCSELVVRDEYDAVESPLLSDPFFQFGQHGRIHPCVHLPPANPVTDGRVDVRPLPRAFGCRVDLAAAEERRVRGKDVHAAEAPGFARVEDRISECEVLGVPSFEVDEVALIVGDREIVFRPGRLLPLSQILAAVHHGFTVESGIGGGDGAEDELIRPRPGRQRHVWAERHHGLLSQRPVISGRASVQPIPSGCRHLAGRPGAGEATSSGPCPRLYRLLTCPGRLVGRRPQ